MAIVEQKHQTKMILKLDDNKTRNTYTIYPDATLDEIKTCAEAINFFQAHEIKEIFRQVTVQLAEE